MSASAQYLIHGKPVPSDGSVLGVYSYGRVNVYYRQIEASNLASILNGLPKLEAFDYALGQLELTREQIQWSKTPKSGFTDTLIEKGLPAPKDIHQVRDAILNYQKFLSAVVEALKDK